MSNSIIINYLINTLSFLKTCYKNSTFVDILSKLDTYMKSALFNSTLVKLFTYKDSSQAVHNSILFKKTTKFLKIIGKTKAIIKKWILGSLIITILKGVILNSQKHPVRLLGLFGVSFLAVSISFEVITNTTNFLSIVIKLVLLLVFLFFSKINVSLKNMLAESKFFSVFKWVINHDA